MYSYKSTDTHMSSSSSSSSGISFTGALTVLFIGLKLTHVINWSWWWVLSPIWISALFVFAIILIVAIVAVIAFVAVAICWCCCPALVAGFARLRPFWAWPVAGGGGRASVGGGTPFVVGLGGLAFVHQQRSNEEPAGNKKPVNDDGGAPQKVSDKCVIEHYLQHEQASKTIEGWNVAELGPIHIDQSVVGYPHRQVLPLG